MNENARNARKQVNVHLPQELKDRLDGVVGISGYSQNDFLERLIKYAASLDTATLKRIIEHGSGTEMNKLVSRMEWGDHMYQRARWAWAIEIYARIDGDDTVNSNALKVIVQFRLALSWGLLAGQLREAAQQCGRNERDLRHQLYEAAKDCLRASLYYFRREPLAHDSVIRPYNEVCALVLLAQYCSEQQQRPSSRQKQVKPARQPNKVAAEFLRLTFQAEEMLQRIELPAQSADAEWNIPINNVSALMLHALSDQVLNPIHDAIKQWTQGKSAAELRLQEQRHCWGCLPKNAQLPRIEELLRSNPHRE